MRILYLATLKRFDNLVQIATLLALTSMGGLANASDWFHYGGSLAGDRYASPSSINPQTVKQLSVAWTYRTGDGTDGRDYDGNPSKFRATPILVEGKLIASTGFNRVFAVDPATGKEIWKFDPEVDFRRSYSEMFTSRGVAAWRDPSSTGDQCRTRVFLGTLDARLFAIDAHTGILCGDFGKGGQVDLSEGIQRLRRRDFSVTSPPTVVGDLVIVGSAIGDNGAAELEPGVVRAYDVLDGSLIWSWDPIPRYEEHPGAASWTNVKQNRTGGANVWSVMSADPAMDLVFLPTTSPSPDFYGGMRLGDNAFSNSVVALRASTGAFVWGYQTIRHDLWDYDLASQPLLFDFVASDGSSRPALAQATKTGFVFVLDRQSGEPLHPVEERKVPASDIPGERAASTQPFPKLQLHPTDIRPLKVWGFNDVHRAACEGFLSGVRYEGIFTPPSLQGTLLFPGNPGGTNWGSMAYDAGSRIGFLVVNRLPTIVKLIPRQQYGAAARRGTFNGARAQHTRQAGTPYGMARFDVQSGYIPCFKGPWSTLVAIDLDEGTVLWERPTGTIPWIDLPGYAASWGLITTGGPMVTEGGVVFLGNSSDNTIRGFDRSNGSELWSSSLPAGVHATPMGYRHKEFDYVVVAAGGNLSGGSGRGDHLIAFRIPIE